MTNRREVSALFVALLLAALSACSNGGSKPTSASSSTACPSDATRFDVPSEAMAPTIRAQDQVRVIEGNYQPRRGDVIVFEAPPEERTASITMPVKRVIGLPGDTIEARGGKVYVNDTPMNEPYLR